MNEPRLHVSKRLRDLMAYDKMAGEAPRLLILRGEYWLDRACENAARQLGWQVESAPVAMEGVLTKPQLARLFETLVALRPDFILSINLSGMDCGGMLARLFEDLRVPHVTWFVDDPRTIIMDRSAYASAYAVGLTWDAAYAPYLRAVGFEHVYRMPLAVDATVFNQEAPATWRHPPTFVGNSMETIAERAWAAVADRPLLMKAIQHAFETDRVSRDAFGRGLEAMLDPACCQALDAEDRHRAEMLLFIEGTRRLRRGYVELLANEGLEVRGDEAWQRVAPGAGAALDYTRELPAFYGACELNLNITSIQMPNAVNQRVFDCPAAGGFLLTDAQPDLAELFDVESEVAAYAAPDECREKFRWYRAHPAARSEIVRRARARILREHTYPHRLRSIARIVLDVFG